jgi:hypothetical protein
MPFLMTAALHPIFDSVVSDVNPPGKVRLDPKAGLYLSVSLNRVPYDAAGMSPHGTFYCYTVPPFRGPATAALNGVLALLLFHCHTGSSCIVSLHFCGGTRRCRAP